jgi:hypothetical protein
MIQHFFVVFYGHSFVDLQYQDKKCSPSPTAAPALTAPLPAFSATPRRGQIIG